MARSVSWLAGLFYLFIPMKKELKEKWKETAKTGYVAEVHFDSDTNEVTVASIHKIVSEGKTGTYYSTIEIHLPYDGNVHTANVKNISGAGHGYINKTEDTLPDYESITKKEAEEYISDAIARYPKFDLTNSLTKSILKKMGLEIDKSNIKAVINAAINRLKKIAKGIRDRNADLRKSLRRKKEEKEAKTRNPQKDKCKFEPGDWIMFIGSDAAERVIHAIDADKGGIVITSIFNDKRRSYNGEDYTLYEKKVPNPKYDIGKTIGDLRVSSYFYHTTAEKMMYVVRNESDPESLDMNIEEGDLLFEAGKLVVRKTKAETFETLRGELQRKLQIGYNAAEGLVVRLKAEGVWSESKEQLKPVPGSSSPIQVTNVQTRYIHTDVKRFQNRQNEYSEESKNRIVQAYDNGTFDFAKFDPITIWQDPRDNKFYVLSGHSRFAAFKELGNRDKTFKSIPARVFVGTEEQAIDLALNSNVLSTKESDMERGIYYHNQRNQCEIRRKKDGLGKELTCEQETELKCRENEGKNAPYILALSYLNPDGYLADSMKRVGADKGTDDANIIRTIAGWVGDIRKRYPDVSDAQETEIAKYLIGGGYGSKSNQFKNKEKFIMRFQFAFDKWKRRGADPLESLNIANAIAKTAFEQEYDERLAKAEQAYQEAKADYDTKHLQYWRWVTEGKMTVEEMNAKEKQLVAYVNKCLDEKKRILGQRDDVKKANAAQQTLWGFTRKKKPTRANRRRRPLNGNDINVTL